MKEKQEIGIRMKEKEGRLLEEKREKRRGEKEIEINEGLWKKNGRKEKEKVMKKNEGKK